MAKHEPDALFITIWRSLEPLVLTIWESLQPLVITIVREQMESSKDADGYMTTAEAAKVAKLKPATVREWARTGRLRVHRVGRLLRVTRADLDHAIANGGPRRETTESRARSEARRALAGR